MLVGVFIMWKELQVIVYVVDNTVPGMQPGRRRSIFNESNKINLHDIIGDD